MSEVIYDSEPRFAAFVAIDWADKKHVWSLQAADSAGPDAHPINRNNSTLFLTGPTQMTRSLSRQHVSNELLIGDLCRHRRVQLFAQWHFALQLVGEVFEEDHVVLFFRTSQRNPPS